MKLRTFEEFLFESEQNSDGIETFIENLKEKDAHKIESNDSYFLCLIKTYEGMKAVHYCCGSSTKWATSKKEYWDKYKEDKWHIYFLYDKVKSKKFAIAAHKSGVEVFNAENYQIDADKFFSTYKLSKGTFK